MQRKYAYRRKLPHYQWTDKTYFITFATRNREILSHYARDFVLETCLVGNGKQYQLHAVVVMPDHVHLGLTPLADEDGPISLLEILQEIKSVSAHRINKYLGRKGSLWQQESFDRAMREVENTFGKLEYVLGNPVRAGLVSNPYDYRWLWTPSTGRAPAPPKSSVERSVLIKKKCSLAGRRWWRTEQSPSHENELWGVRASSASRSYVRLSLASPTPAPINSDPAIRFVSFSNRGLRAVLNARPASCP